MLATCVYYTMVVIGYVFLYDVIIKLIKVISSYFISPPGQKPRELLVLFGIRGLWAFHILNFTAKLLNQIEPNLAYMVLGKRGFIFMQMKWNSYWGEASYGLKRIMYMLNIFYIIISKVLWSPLITMEYWFHRWPWNHNPVLSSFMIDHRVSNKSNTTDATCGARATYPSGAPEFTSGF